jgi:hypothetical protein
MSLSIEKTKPHSSIIKKWGSKSPYHTFPPGKDWRGKICQNDSRMGGDVNTQDNLPPQSAQKMSNQRRSWTKLNLGRRHDTGFEVINSNQGNPFYPAG